MLLKSVYAKPDSSFEAKVTIPAGAVEGPHATVVVCVDNNGESVDQVGQPFTVTAATANPQPPTGGTPPVSPNNSSHQLSNKMQR